MHTAETNSAKWGRESVPSHDRAQSSSTREVSKPPEGDPRHHIGDARTPGHATSPPLIPASCHQSPTGPPPPQLRGEAGRSMGRSDASVKLMPRVPLQKPVVGEQTNGRPLAEVPPRIYQSPPSNPPSSDDRARCSPRPAHFSASESQNPNKKLPPHFRHPRKT